MEFSGLPDYAFDFRHAVVEAWNPLSLEISQFTRLRGLWQLEDGELSGSYFGEMAECYTGRLDWRDYLYSATLVPHVGSEHYVLFRVEGGIRSYAVGLTSGNRVGLFRNENGYRELAAAPFSWSFGEEYRVDVEARGPDFGISINGRPVLRYMDQHGPYLTGMVGLANRGGSHTHYRSWSMKGLE
jgi:hypothetical protein